MRFDLGSADDAVTRFLLRLGGLLLGGGLGARDVEAVLRSTAAALGHPGAEIAALPTGIFVALSEDRPARFRSARAYIRFDQVSSFLSIAGRVQAGRLGVGAATNLLRRASAVPPSWPYLIANLGAIPVACGLVLLLSPTATNVAIAAVGGAVVALLASSAGRVKAIAELLPFASALIVSAPILLLSNAGIADHPFRTIVAVLAILFPGSVFVTGVADLVAGHSSAGTARLAAALMQFALFFTGIFAAVALTGSDIGALLDAPPPVAPVAAKLAGVVLASVGIMLFCYCPWRHAGWIIALSTAAGGVQVIVGQAVSPAMGGACAALLASLGAQLLARAPKAPPWHVTYLPAFMIVAPGSFGFLAATQPGASIAGPVLTAGSAFLGVALGTLLGGAVKELEFTKTYARGARRRRA